MRDLQICSDLLLEQLRLVYQTWKNALALTIVPGLDVNKLPFQRIASETTWNVTLSMLWLGGLVIPNARGKDANPRLFSRRLARSRNI